MSTTEAVDRVGEASTSGRRTVVVSQRNGVLYPAASILFEFEDLIAEWEAAKVFSLARGRESRVYRSQRSTFQAARLAGVPEGFALSRLPLVGGRRVEGQRSFDLGVVVVSSAFDLFAVHEVFKSGISCGHLIAVVAELWPSAFDSRAFRLEPWSCFDRVYVAHRQSAEHLDSLIDAPVRYLPLGVDALSFGRHAKVERPIAVLNPGRRHEQQHRILYEACELSDRWYEFDTLIGAEMSDHRQHRRQYQLRMGRSGCVIANKAKFDLDESIVGTYPIAPGRVLEALASGCAIAGSDLSGTALDDLGLAGLDVADFPYDVDLAGAQRLLGSLDLSEETIAERMSLARIEHDWAHRWKQILDDLGCASTQSHEQRISSLADPQSVVPNDAPLR